MPATESPPSAATWQRSRPARALLVLLPALLATLVFATRVQTDFPRVRLRIVTQPVTADGTAMRVKDIPLARLAGEPAAIVLRVGNPGPGPLRVQVRAGEQLVAERRVRPARDTRLDMAARLDETTSEVVIETDRAGWTLNDLEIANVHGFSGKPFPLVIVPAARTPPRAPPIASVALLAALLALGAWGRRLRAWPLRLLLRVLAAVSLGLLVMVLIARLVSPFGVVLSPRAFWTSVALLYAGPLLAACAGIGTAGWRALAWVIRSEHRAAVGVRRVARSSLKLLPHAAVVLLVLACLRPFYVPGSGLTRLVAFGDRFAPRAAPALRSIAHEVEHDSWGYDGQFYAQMAFDPLLRDPDTLKALDAPAYRTRRVLFPLLAHLVGLGRPAWVLHAYTTLNIVSWLALAVLLLRWLPPGTGRAFAAWAGCLLSHGMLCSVLLALPDGPSVLLIALAVLAVERGRRGAAAALIGVATLGKETNLLAGGIVLPFERRRPGLAVVARLLVTVLPLVLWMIYLRSFGLGASAGHDNFAAPLTGYVSKWTETLAELRASGWDSPARFSIFTLVGLLTQVLVIGARADWRRPWWRIGAAYAVLFLCVGPAVWSGYRGAVTRVVLPLSVAFNLLLPGGRWFWPLWLLGNLNVLHGLEAIRAPWISGVI